MRLFAVFKGFPTRSKISPIAFLTNEPVGYSSSLLSAGITALPTFTNSSFASLINTSRRALSSVSACDKSYMYLLIRSSSVKSSSFSSISVAWYRTFLSLCSNAPVSIRTAGAAAADPRSIIS